MKPVCHKNKPDVTCDWILVPKHNASSICNALAFPTCPDLSVQEQVLILLGIFMSVYAELILSESHDFLAFHGEIFTLHCRRTLFWEFPLS